MISLEQLLNVRNPNLTEEEQKKQDELFALYAPALLGAITVQEVRVVPGKNRKGQKVGIPVDVKEYVVK